MKLKLESIQTIMSFGTLISILFKMTIISDLALSGQLLVTIFFKRERERDY